MVSRVSACRALARKDTADRRLVTHRNMVKLHLLVRETLADFSESDEDEQNIREGALQCAVGANVAIETLSFDGHKECPVPSAYINTVALPQGFGTPSSLFTNRVKTASAGHPFPVDSPAAGERTPDLSSVPDTPKGDLHFGSEQKHAQEKASQHRSSLLRSALHAAAISALANAGVQLALVRMCS